MSGRDIIEFGCLSKKTRWNVWCVDKALESSLFCHLTSKLFFCLRVFTDIFSVFLSFVLGVTVTHLWWKQRMNKLAQSRERELTNPAIRGQVSSRKKIDGRYFEPMAISMRNLNFSNNFAMKNYYWTKSESYILLDWAKRKP